MFEGVGRLEGRSEPLKAIDDGIAEANIPRALDDNETSNALFGTQEFLQNDSMKRTITLPEAGQGLSWPTQSTRASGEKWPR